MTAAELRAMRAALATFRRGLAAWNANGNKGQFAPLGYAFGGIFIAADSAGGTYAWRADPDGPWHPMPDVAAPVTDEQVGALR